MLRGRRSSGAFGNNNLRGQSVGTSPDSQQLDIHSIPAWPASEPGLSPHPVDHDTSIRVAAFERVRQLEARFGDAIPWSAIANWVPVRG